MENKRDDHVNWIGAGSAQRADARHMVVDTPPAYGIELIDLARVLDRLQIRAAVEVYEHGQRAGFEFCGQRLGVDVAGDGSNFVVLASCWKSSTGSFRPDLLERLNQFNAWRRYVKAQWLPRGAVILTVEVICLNEKHLISVFKPYLAELHRVGISMSECA